MVKWAGFIVAAALVLVMAGGIMTIAGDAKQLRQQIADAQQEFGDLPTVRPANQGDEASGSARLNAQLGEGWSITSFDAQYRLTAEGRVEVTEDIAVDFFELERHGIFRDLNDRIPCGAPIAGAQQPIYECPAGHDRVYRIDVLGVTDFSGKPLTYKVERAEGSGREATRIRIGDADKIVTGQQEYRIRYTVGGALDAYVDHDELYWDASGQWPVPMEAFTLRLELPAGADLDAVCYEGYQSAERCDSIASGNVASYRATRTMYPNEEVTIVGGWQKGLVEVPAPILKDRPSIDDYFALDGWELGGAGLLGIVAVAGVSGLWWTNGRDRRYTSIYYLTDDPESETRPLFAADDVVVEYTPPDDLRPAQMGLILDERADTLDVTATIIDLAVRGYIHITEIPKTWWFGSKDWRLTQTRSDTDELLPYEAKLMESLFADGTEVEMSDLKDKFHTKLSRVKEQLYKDGMQRKWFPRAPETAKAMWMAAGFGVMALGAAVSVGAGYFLGRGLFGLGVVAAGLVMVGLSRSMARRTPRGSEALRRVLGFRLYVATAETRIQDYNEQQNILDKFAKYLPYAIVFGCVDKWAKAFKGLEGEAEKATTSWYTGTAPFQVAAFSSGLRGFSSSVSSTLSSTPSSSGSGGSGFSGGSSGGGGGGGGGGSW